MTIYSSFLVWKNHTYSKPLGVVFFHDGIVSRIRFEPHIKSLSFRINAPNFFSAKYDRYLDADFTCRFMGVRLFEVFSPKPTLGEVKFEIAEFNSLGVARRRDLILYPGTPASPNGACEVLLSCIAENEILISIVFEEFYMKPRDLTQYHLLCEHCGVVPIRFPRLW